MRKFIFSIILSLVLVAGFGNLAEGQICPCTQPSDCIQWCIENDLCDSLPINLGLDCGCGTNPIILAQWGTGSNIWCNRCYMFTDCPGACASSWTSGTWIATTLYSTGGPDYTNPSICYTCYDGTVKCGVTAHWDPLSNTWHIF